MTGVVGAPVTLGGAEIPGIPAHCRWRLHTSLLEGINNRIKVIKRMAYGFHDDESFFLKIRAAFLGDRP